jgi:capsular polysaccharide biosynthesis protein
MVYARGQLRDAMDKYSALRTQIESAEIDLETAKAAFKYRYSVVTPAHLPRKPVKPNAPLVILVGVVASILCALLSSVLIDVLAGKVLERWQMESLLDGPVMGEVAMRRLKGPELE